MIAAHRIPGCACAAVAVAHIFANASNISPCRPREEKLEAKEFRETDSFILADPSGNRYRIFEYTEYTTRFRPFGEPEEITRGPKCYNSPDVDLVMCSTIDERTFKLTVLDETQRPLQMMAKKVW